MLWLGRLSNVGKTDGEGISAVVCEDDLYGYNHRCVLSSPLRLTRRSSDLRYVVMHDRSISARRRPGDQSRMGQICLVTGVEFLVVNVRRRSK